VNSLQNRLKVYARRDESGTSLLERKRILSGLSTLALAKEAGVSRNSVWRIERNHRSQALRPNTALKILKALGNRLEMLGQKACTFEDLFELTSVWLPHSR
jgi:transcriptional regulator with XRE-family HTH domain